MNHCSSLSATTDWDRLSYPRLCALLAAHPSRLSQAMHNAAFQAAGAEFSYVAFKSERTEIGLEAMRALGIRGLSLTIPHKERAMSLVDAIAPEVEKIGAINTVINTGSALIGYNTDCYGVQKALEESARDLAGLRVLVFGAGGASRAALYALSEMDCQSVTVSNRTEKRARDLAAQFSTEVCSFDRLASLDGSEFDVFINSSAIGMPGTEPGEYPFDLKLFDSRHLVFDMITAETELISRAEAQGAAVLRGLRMLLHQAVEQNRLFRESSPDVSAMEKALQHEYEKLTGLKG